MKNITQYNHRSSSKNWRKGLRLMMLPIIMVGLFACLPDQEEDYYDGIAPMGQGIGIGNISLVVEDLDSTLNYFVEVLGFKAPRGGEARKGLFAGTKGYQINFADMSSIDLITVDDSLARTMSDTLTELLLSQGVGMRMYAISSADVDSTQSWLTRRGFSMDSVSTIVFPRSSPPKSNWRPSESLIAKVGFEGSYPPTYLPEFVELVGFPYFMMREWFSFYHMQRPYVKHPNGTVGVHSLQLVVDDFAVARTEFRKMGFEELEGNPTEKMARFKVKGNQEIHLTSPQAPDDELARFLEERGPGLFAVSFEVGNLDSTLTFLQEKLPEGAIMQDTSSKRLIVGEAYAKGMRLVFTQEPAEQALFAQKFKMEYGVKLDTVAAEYAEGMYLKYCALCHGDNREGYAADNAPSLRSHSLLATAENTNFLRYTIQYGRANTAMAGYYDQQGGPMNRVEIELLLRWLKEMSGMEEPVELSRDPIAGDIQLGERLYAAKCASCHGENGEGVSAPALGHPMLLATATDHFLRYAIAEGRDGTPMLGFKDSLSSEEIDGITAFLRSRASGWDVPQGDSIKVPEPEEYVLNPEGERPNFTLRDGRFLPAEQLNEALANNQRVVLLDARSTVAWRQTHIPGAIPVPYYEDVEGFLEDIPKDSTWVVAYCACPHAASGSVIDKIKTFGYEHTAILDEGVLVWAQMGFPVRSGH